METSESPSDNCWKFKFSFSHASYIQGQETCNDVVDQKDHENAGDHLAFPDWQALAHRSANRSWETCREHLSWFCLDVSLICIIH